MRAASADGWPGAFRSIVSEISQYPYESYPMDIASDDTVRSVQSFASQRHSCRPPFVGVHCRSAGF